MKYICTRSFQFRGTMIKSGTAVDIDETTARTPYVSSHVTPMIAEAKKPATAPQTPAKIAEDDVTDMTVAQIKSRLAKLGVHYTNKMTREDLITLYKQAQEAVAGSPAEPNAPKNTGK